MRHAGTLGLALALMMGASTFAHAQTAKEAYTSLEYKELIPGATGSLENHGPVSFLGGGSAASVLGSFQGISQYDVASFGRDFIPPDTMGAAGKTQLMEFVNGGVAVYDKATGTQLSKVSDIAFWATAGQTGANGDSRVMYDKAADRWIALSFGGSISDIQIAVSNTSDATGGWKSTSFTGFAGGIADYPTLALDTNAVYIGTNNFSGAAGNPFRGTTLNVIPIASLVNALAPTTTGITSFNTPYNGGGADGGIAIQGVNSNVASTTGHVIAASLFFNDVIAYDIANTGTPAAAKVNAQYVGTADYAINNGAGRQPNVGGIASNNRVVDTLDQRIGSSAYEVNGRIYAVYTVTPVGGDHTYVRYDVVDAVTHQLLSEGQIGDGVHDYYEGSLAVNSQGRVVIAYNRSGSGADGKISVLAEVFTTNLNGALTQRGSELLLKVSDIDNYHNGSPEGSAAAGRQRWGDYSAVSLDPTNDNTFWVFGEFAREYNNAAGGHPGGSGFSRWGTYIAAVDGGTEVPEPSVWAMLIAGFGLTGAAMRRQRRSAQTA